MAFVGITSEGESDLEDSKAFLNEFGITWPNAYGAAAALEALGVNAFPTIVVFGADGRVFWNDEMGGDLDDAVQAALWVRDHPGE